MLAYELIAYYKGGSTMSMSLFTARKYIQTQRSISLKNWSIALTNL